MPNSIPTATPPGGGKPRSAKLRRPSGAFTSLPSTCQAVARTRLAGNIVPPQWLRRIRTETGKPFAEAALLLAEIWGWYVPHEERDAPTSDVRYRKRFEHDMLVLTYAQVGALFGWNKPLAKAAYDRLEAMGLVEIQWRHRPGESNILHVRPVVARVVEITYASDDEIGVRSPAPRGRTRATHPPKKEGDGLGLFSGDHPSDSGGDHPPKKVGDDPLEKVGDITISPDDISKRGGGEHAGEREAQTNRDAPAGHGASSSSGLEKGKGKDVDVASTVATIAHERNASMALVRLIEDVLGSAYVPRAASGAPRLAEIDRLLALPHGLEGIVQIVADAAATGEGHRAFRARLLSTTPGRRSRAAAEAPPPPRHASRPDVVLAPEVAQPNDQPQYLSDLLGRVLGKTS